MPPRPTAIADPSTTESNIRDILSRLRTAHDADTAEILASGLNTFESAMIRFRGSSAYLPSDIHALFELWNILLNVAMAKAPQVFDFAPKPKLGDTTFTEEPGGALSPEPKPTTERRI